MKSTLVLSAVVLAALTAFTAGPAQARSTFPAEIPNGTTFSCLTCHVRAGGGEGWNVFGQAILSKGGANPEANATNQNLGFEGSPSDYWLDLCEDDSDGDGNTNGEELNDIDCDAVEDADGALSNPGDPASTPDDPGDGGSDGGSGAVGCAAAPAAPVAFLALLTLARRRRL